MLYNYYNAFILIKHFLIINCAFALQLQPRQYHSIVGLVRYVHYWNHSVKMKIYFLLILLVYLGKFAKINYVLVNFYFIPLLSNLCVTVIIDDISYEAVTKSPRLRAKQLTPKVSSLVSSLVFTFILDPEFWSFMYQLSLFNNINLVDGSNKAKSCFLFIFHAYLTLS